MERKMTKETLGRRSNLHYMARMVPDPFNFIFLVSLLKSYSMILKVTNIVASNRDKNRCFWDHRLEKLIGSY